MPHIDAVVTCPVFESFQVQKVAGMFDLPLGEQNQERFTVDLPDTSEDWNIGLIVGPSGSGKTTVASHAYGAQLHKSSKWPADVAVVDCFGDLPVRRVVELLTAVGFGSPPSWLRPYCVLSRGEQFRCELAKALSIANSIHHGGRESATNAKVAGSQIGDAERPLIAFDEFTSVVDRTVAKACSSAIAKGIRRSTISCRFVAVTCHYDVAEWLEADWVLDMSTTQLTRRRLRRPPIHVEIRRCQMAAWKLFARHHYLTGSLAPGSRCYLATWEGEPVTFCATLPVITKKNHRRFSRIVTLPDYQGMGIGMRVVAAVACRA